MADEDMDDIEKELDNFIEKEEKEEKERKEKIDEDPDELEKGQRETLDTKRKEPRVLDDSSGQSDNEDSEQDDYKITEDQHRALQELENLKREMDYPDEDPPEYNVKERLKELNQELANDPTPVENNREPKVLFKENLVDLVAPPPEYSDDETKSKSPENTRPNMEDKENSGKNSEKNKSDKSTSNKVLIERSGTFELVNEDELTAQDLGLATASGEKAKKNSKNKNEKEPRPPSKPRPATAGESARRNVRPQASQQRPHSAQSHSSSLSDSPGYNSPYGLSPKQKELAKQRAEALEKKKKEDEKKKKEEDEEKQRESMEAFQFWLKKKKEEDRKKKEEEEQVKKTNRKDDKNNNDEEHAAEKAKDVPIERIRRPDPNALTDEDLRSLLEITKENEEAYKEWLKTKSTQIKKDRLLEKRAQQEIRDGYYIRSRTDCEKAFKEWLKQKNAEIRKARVMERQKARAIRMAARKTRRSKTLYRAIRENQAFKYVDYYGYRF